VIVSPRADVAMNAGTREKSPDLGPKRPEIQGSFRASDGNRTRTTSLGSWSSAIELRSRDRTV
jgi:hypothetical protein